MSHRWRETVAAVILPMALLSCAPPDPREQDVSPADPWRLTIVHPSLDADGLYRCTLTLPADYPINELMGFTIVIVDRGGRTLGTVPMRMDIDGEERRIEGRLAADVIKRSYVMFQADPDTERARVVRLRFGDHKTIRRVGGEIVREPIE
jgi:hypothetical protein